MLLVLPTATYRARDFVEAAAALGVELSIASEDVPPLGLEDRFVTIDCSDPDSSAATIADLAAKTPIDAIVATDDSGVVVAAKASQMIGLPHNPPEAAAATVDKVRMREALRSAEVPQPDFEVLEDGNTTIPFPVVVKPSSLNASRGVIRVDEPAALAGALERIRRVAVAAGRPADEIIAERFVPGPEVSLEGLLWNGRLEVLAVFDKPDPLDGPFFEETIFVTPSRLDSRMLEEVVATTERAAAALGLSEGPIHAELRVGAGHPQVIEVAARTIGGLCGRALSFGLMNTSLEVLVLRHALGMRKRGLRRSPGAAGVMMIPTPGPGTLVGVQGLDEARSVSGVTEIELTVPPGSTIAPPPDGDRYLGFMFARADAAGDVESALREAHQRLIIEIADGGPTG